MTDSVRREPEKYILTKAGYEQIKTRLAQAEARRLEQQTAIDDFQQDADQDAPDEAAEFEIRTKTEHLDEQIGHLRLVLETAEIVEDDPDPRRVDLGDRVTVWNISDRTQSIYDLVSGTEATYLNEDQPDEGIDTVAADSPVGQALMGACLGDVFDVGTPDGIVRYAVRAITPIAAAQSDGVSNAGSVK